MTFPHDTESLAPRHVEDEGLLAYLDGELDPELAHRTAAHLEQCWQCRGRLHALESNIREFLAAREPWLPPDLTDADVADVAFRERLASHVSAVAPRASRRLLALAALPWRYAVAGTAVVAVLVAGVAWWWAEPVSAREAMARSDVRELLEVRASKLVVRSVVSVTRVDGDSANATPLGVVETHTDPMSSAVSVNVRITGRAAESEVLWGREALGERRVLPGVLPSPLASFLEARRWAPGVSVSGYLRLIGDRGITAESASRFGESVMVSHPFPAGHPSGLTESRLYISRRSWLPTQVSLFTADAAGRHEFRFTRDTLEFLPRTPEYARLFASVAPSPTPVTATRRAPSSPATADNARPSVPSAMSWDTAPATDAEVAAASALHALAADLGEEVNVFPLSDGAVLVQGLVDADARRQAIRHALAGMTALRVDVRTPDDAASGTGLFAPPWRPLTDVEVLPSSTATTPIRVIDAAGLHMPMQRRLEEHLNRAARDTGADASSVSRAVSGFANDLLSRSRLALLHAWALYRLDQQFSPARASGLSASSLDVVATLRRSHRDDIARLARELDAAIEPFVGAHASGVPNAVVPDSATLLRLVSESDALVRELFTVSASGVDPAASLARLVALLDQVG